MTSGKLPYYSFIRRFCGLFIFTVVLFTSVTAQDRCGTVEYNKMMHKSISTHDKEVQFENWLSKKIIQQKTSIKSKQLATVLEIPVVVHIIHNNEPLGSGVNITDAQIQSQIDVLNEDFRRLNTDRVNTPTTFADVAADVEVEFMMAKRDPEGLATTGILRVAGTQSSWAMSDNITLKSLSYWPAEDYLNIWVTAISGTLLGYAQFPVSDELDGLEEGSFNALTDGIVIDYEVFGSIDKYPPANLKSSFNKGRTATHEVGHFLGLRHIWGDEDCGTDYCVDTPIQRSSSSGCPSHPASNGCDTSEKMFQNFMDYSSDQCMNLFTLDQNARMRTVLENSPRRQSLTTSLALLDPTIFDNDLGIFDVSSPENSTCQETVTPSILVKNYGNSVLNNAEIKVTLNGIDQEVLTASLGSLNQLESTLVTFSEVSLVEGDNILEFEILTVNGITDQGINNNIINYTVNIPIITAADLTEDFQGSIQNMTIDNIDGLTTWEIISAPDGSTGNRALYINYFDYQNEGTEDQLLSAVMDFSSIPFARLTFDYAHSKYPGRDDQLKVLVSTDCGQSFQVLFDKSGDQLMTTENTSTVNFIPNSTDDWKSQSIDLLDYVGNPTIQIAFVGKNNFGNNIYLDNISLITSDATSIKLRQIDTPPIVTSSTTQPLNITVKNTGSFTIDELDISYSVDGGISQSFTKTDLNIRSGMSSQITVGNFTSLEAEHAIEVTISKPNGLDDVDVSDNSLILDYVIDLSSDVIPLKENFETDNDWVKVTRSGVQWESINIEGDNIMYVNGAQNPNIGGQAWLVSPILDFSQTTEASLFFDMSYASSSNGQNETLEVLLSEDGGLDNYPNILFERSNKNLVTYEQTVDNWLPKSNYNDHWDRQYIDLSEFAGKEDIRIAFLLTNGNGNNIYLDNIEFFTQSDPLRVYTGAKEVSHFPNPIYSTTGANLNLIFKLAERQKTTIRIYDLAGNQVFEQIEPYTLNQTFSYNVGGLPTGMLILSVIGETFRYNKRVTIIR